MPVKPLLASLSLPIPGLPYLKTEWAGAVRLRARGFSQSELADFAGASSLDSDVLAAYGRGAAAGGGAGAGVGDDGRGVGAGSPRMRCRAGGGSGGGQLRAEPPLAQALRLDLLAR